MLIRDEIEGQEFDWFAVDSTGSIALFCTAGYGGVPATVLEAATRDNRPDRQIAELINCLPVAGEYTCEAHGPGNCEEWRSLGQRGVYVYDWVHWNGPYVRIIRPQIVTLSGRVPAWLLSTLNPVIMDKIDFSIAQSLSIDFDSRTNV